MRYMAAKWPGAGCEIVLNIRLFIIFPDGTNKLDPEDLVKVTTCHLRAPMKVIFKPRCVALGGHSSEKQGVLIEYFVKAKKSNKIELIWISLRKLIYHIH